MSEYILREEVADLWQEAAAALDSIALDNP